MHNVLFFRERSVVAGHAGARSRIVRDLFNDDSQFSDLLISENTFEKLVMLSVVLPDFDGTFACKKAPALYDLLGACGMACLARLIQVCNSFLQQTSDTTNFIDINS